MKQEITRYVKTGLLLICCLLFSNCQKAPMNGNADGQWQLMSFETTDGTIHPCKRIYYSIQLQLVEIGNKENDHYETYIGRFNYNRETEKITMSDFRKRSQEEIAATIENLKPFGMNSTETVFDVLKADGKTLILKSEYATLTLRSF